MVVRTLGRLVWVPIAVVLSGMIATMVLVTLGLERITGAAHASGDDAAAVLTVLEAIRQIHLLGSGLTLIPALAVILIGEIARIRTALYYIIGGGLAFLSWPLLARLGSDMDGAVVPSIVVWQVYATAGFVGGAIYWLLAGRRA